MSRKITLVDHLKSCAQAAKTFAGGLVAELAQTVTEAIEEMDGTKADKDSVVPTTRKINGKSLSADVNLEATDVGAAASSHTHAYAGSSSAGGAATSADKLNGTQLTNQNLDDYRTESVLRQYYAADGNTCTNKPSGIDNFGMIVMKTAGGWWTQILYGSDNELYVRNWNGSSWSAWVKIPSGPIATAEIADNAINASKIAAGAVGSSELATDAVTSAKIATNAVTADAIAAGAVGSSELGVNYAGSTSKGGAASSATKLATKRTIAISGGATGTATGFDGTGNISIPVTKLDMSKASGTIPAAVKATNSTDYTTSRIRNIRASTTDLTPKSSALSNGEVYLVYE